MGIIIPIPKGDDDRTRQDNHCGISLMTGFAKLFEKWLLSKLEPWAKDNNTSQIQGAAQPKCSSMQEAWFVRNLLLIILRNRQKVYVEFLDTKKAFDTVWQDGLFHKLFDIGT